MKLKIENQLRNNQRDGGPLFNLVKISCFSHKADWGQSDLVSLDVWETRQPMMFIYSACLNPLSVCTFSF